MRHFCIGLLALGLATSAAADKKYRGATISVDVKQAELQELLRLVADTGRINIVIVDVAPQKLDVTAKNEPWDQLLDELMVRAKVEYSRTGNTFIVGQPAMIAERKKATGKRTYKGSTLDLDVKDADATAAAQLLAAASTPFEIKPGAPRRANLRLKRIPSDLAGELLALQTGGTLVDKPTALAKPSTDCLAPAVAFAKLKLAGIAAAGIKRWALFVDDKGAAFVATKGSCLGVEKAPVKDLGSAYVTVEIGGAEQAATLYPTTP